MSKIERFKTYKIIGFVLSFQWIVCFIVLGIVGYIIEKYNKIEYGISMSGILFGIPMFLGVFGYIGLVIISIRLYKDTDLIEGSSKKIRREERKKRKLQNQVRYLQIIKSNKQESLKIKEEQSKLKCEIKLLELEEVSNFYTCSKCGTKNPKTACFCSKCGEKF